MVVLTRRRLLPALLERTTPGHRARTEQILREVGMWEKRDSLAQDLSYGQRKLLEIGRAMALDVRTYLFDEPFAGLFPQMLERVKEIVIRMRDQGRTLIFISHNMDIVRELPDHLIVLDSGRLLTQGEVHDVLSRKEVIEGVPGRLGARRRTAMTQNSASGLAGAPSTDAALLELNGVSVHYGAVVALDDVSLGIRKGEVVAVMGPNGAGKSTVLKAIMGLAPVVAGEVHWRQQRLAAATHEIVKEGIAFVPQGRRVFTHLTIEENLELGCLSLGDGAEKARRLDAVMEFFPILREKRRDMASQMSGGQQQMLALGRGLMAGPELLLLDEPTLGLAADHRERGVSEGPRDQRPAEHGRSCSSNTTSGARWRSWTVPTSSTWAASSTTARPNQSAKPTSSRTSSSAASGARTRTLRAARSAPAVSAAGTPDHLDPVGFPVHSRSRRRTAQLAVFQRYSIG